MNFLSNFSGIFLNSMFSLNKITISILIYPVKFNSSSNLNTQFYFLANYLNVGNIQNFIFCIKCLRGYIFTTHLIYDSFFLFSAKNTAHQGNPDCDACLKNAGSGCPTRRNAAPAVDSSFNRI